MYSLGLILLELSCNITTTHEKMTTFMSVKQKRELPSNDLKDTIEGELILSLTQEDPKMRPCAKEIQSSWLPRWSRRIENC